MVLLLVVVAVVVTAVVVAGVGCWWLLLLLLLLPFPSLCLAAKAGRGRLSGGRERGDCHFWSHSAIQRKLSLKSAGSRNLPSAGRRGQQGSDGLSGLCPSQGFPQWGSEA